MVAGLAVPAPTSVLNGWTIIAPRSVQNRCKVSSTSCMVKACGCGAAHRSGRSPGRSRRRSWQQRSLPANPAVRRPERSGPGHGPTAPSVRLPAVAEATERQRSGSGTVGSSSRNDPSPSAASQHLEDAGIGDPGRGQPWDRPWSARRTATSLGGSRRRSRTPRPAPRAAASSVDRAKRRPRHVGCSASKAQRGPHPLVEDGGLAVEVRHQQEHRPILPCRHRASDTAGEDGTHDPSKAGAAARTETHPGPADHRARRACGVHRRRRRRRLDRRDPARRHGDRRRPAAGGTVGGRWTRGCGFSGWSRCWPPSRSRCRWPSAAEPARSGHVRRDRRTGRPAATCSRDGIRCRSSSTCDTTPTMRPPARSSSSVAITSSRVSASSVPKPSSMNRVSSSRPPTVGRDDIGESQRESQRGQEGLPTGQCPGRTLPTRPASSTSRPSPPDCAPGIPAPTRARRCSGRRTSGRAGAPAGDRDFARVSRAST